MKSESEGPEIGGTEGRSRAGRGQLSGGNRGAGRRSGLWVGVGVGRTNEGGSSPEGEKRRGKIEGSFSYTPPKFTHYWDIVSKIMIIAIWPPKSTVWGGFLVKLRDHLVDF